MGFGKWRIRLKRGCVKPTTTQPTASAHSSLNAQPRRGINQSPARFAGWGMGYADKLQAFLVSGFLEWLSFPIC